MALPPLMSSPMAPNISPATTPPQTPSLPSPASPPTTTNPLLHPPVMSPSENPLPPVVSPVSTSVSPLTFPSPAVAPPLPVTTPMPSPPITSPVASAPPPSTTTTTPLAPEPPSPTPPGPSLPSTATPPRPASQKPSRPHPATPSITPPPALTKPSHSPPPTLSPPAPHKSTISPAPVATTLSPPPKPHKSITISPAPAATTQSPTSSPVITSAPPALATPLLPTPPSPTSSSLPSPTSSSLPSPTSSSLPSPSSSSHGSFPAALQVQKPRPSTSSGLIVGCIIGGVVILLVLVICLLCVCHRRWRKRNKLGFIEDYRKATSLVPKEHVHHSVPPSSLPTPHIAIGINSGSDSTTAGSEVPNPHQTNGVGLVYPSGIFTYDQLVVATNGFSEANLLGQGGFGYVHKGVLPSGREVAVKRLKIGSRQGEREFRAEVDIISRVHHKHLVSLVGYCITGAERLLVYEFLPNNTLEFHLRGQGQDVMEWATRLKIAVGSAKGLAYLHEDCNPTIIHRDIKAANILLDFRFEAKVSDFGLAKSFSETSTHITHISTQVVGTFGYLAPEYASSGKVTDKSDVYSYGVMLLELITGRPPILTTDSSRNENLVEWARPLLSGAMNEGDFDGLVDPRLHQKYNANEMRRMVVCASACVRHSAWLRPRMSQIVHALEGHASLSELQQGSSTLYSSSASSEYDAQHMKMLNITMANQVYGFSRYSESTSEYGLNPSASSSETQQTI